MAEIVQVEENGQIHLPASLHGWKPHTQLRLLHGGEKLTLEPARPPTFGLDSAREWESRTPAERARSLRNLIASLPEREAAQISDEALRRENMYD